jgi:hypothetical protein
MRYVTANQEAPALALNAAIFMLSIRSICVGSVRKRRWTCWKAETCLQQKKSASKQWRAPYE